MPSQPSRAEFVTMRHAHALVAALVVAAVAAGQGQPSPPSPQLAAVAVTSALGMVVSGSPEASAVGARVLAEGGNAIDAAVAAAFALGVAEPGQSGLGGQTYLLVRFADGRAVAIDGSAVVPLRANRDELRRMRDHGERNGRQLAATPATVATLALALARYGTRTLPEMIAPALDLADLGTLMTSFQRGMFDHYLDRVRDSAYLSRLYLKDRLEPWGLEHTYCQPDLARTLWRIGELGAGDFYKGRIAREIVDDMAHHRGYLRADDLSLVRVVERDPLRGSYRGFEVLGFPAPCAGSAVIETLNILERFSPELLRSESVDRVHVMLEAERLAAADQSLVRDLTPAAASQVIDKGLAARRAAKIRLDRALRREEIGGVDDGAWRDRDTTHLSVADRFGNVVSLTQSLGRGFGCCEADPALGFPYNGILESFELDDAHSRHLLTPMRPLFASIAPTIVLKDGRPFLVLGSAGSSRIAPSVVQTIVDVVDRGMTLAQSEEAPRALWGSSEERNLMVELTPPLGPDTVKALEARGFTRITRITLPAAPVLLSRSGGVNAIMVTADGTMVGVYDPRRGGSAEAPCETGPQPDPPQPAPEYWRDRFAEAADR
jgi:gamma-glutamyltranspeptidase/glutathione hydrolase